MLQSANFQNKPSMVMYAAGLAYAYCGFAIFEVVESISGVRLRRLEGANFQKRFFIIMYITGLGIAHADFVIFGVVDSIEVVRGVSRAEKVAFAIF